MIKIYENYNLLSYFKNIWSKDKAIKDKILSDTQLTIKYGDYLDPNFNWSLLSDDQLKILYDEWLCN